MTRRRPGAALAVTIAIAAGCGDNSERCGDSTIEVDGVCVAADMTTCGNGTKLDDGQCVVDPSTCQSGTVLIANHCIDPASAPIVDLEESPEPNGRGLVSGVEDSVAPAGTISLAPDAAPYVIHGHIKPFRDADHDGQLDPDFDTYLITVGGPVMLDISVDGVGGTQGGFFAKGDPAGPVPSYERYGLNLTGDTSHRRLVVPAAGVYALSIADTRSLAIGNNPPQPAGAGGAAGSDRAEYYASITVEPLPVPANVAVTNGIATQTGTLAADEVKVLTAALPAGSYRARETISAAGAASVAVLIAGQLRGYADETPVSMSTPASPAEVAVELLPGEVPIIVVDAVYNYGPGPAPFTLTFGP